MFGKVDARIDRAVRRRPWLDHLVRAAGRYRQQRGDYYAAGITYFTVLSLFPLLMVAFAVTGFVFSHNQDLLHELERKVLDTIPGSLGNQLNDLIEQAVNSRTGVGVLGLLAGVYAGLGWMANLRAALTEQWEQKHEDGNWVRTKLSDLGALIGLGLAMVVSLGLSAIAVGDLGRRLLTSMGLEHAPGVSLLLTMLSLVLAALASWAVFMWIIARLPRESVTPASAAKAAVIAAVAFEIFKQIASIYLRIVSRSPAGVAFGSIIGVMVFGYITARIILFATAWAATARENMVQNEIPVPGPALIEPRVSAAGLSVGAGAALFGAGALAVLGFSGLRRR